MAKVRLRFAAVLSIVSVVSPALGAPRAITPKMAQALARKAEARVKALDYEAAVPLFERALTSPAFAPDQRAALLLQLGVAYVNVGRTDDARATFEESIRHDNTITLPSNSSPKIRELFDSVRDAVIPPPPPPAPPPAAEPTPAPAVEAAPPPFAPTPVVAPPADVTQATPKRSWIPPVAVALVGALAGGGGAFAALQSQSTASQLSAAPHDATTTARMVGQQRTDATLAVVGYSAAGVAAAVAATLVILRLGDGDAQVHVARTAGGVSVALEARF